jgi:hypothetical protein
MKFFADAIVKPYIAENQYVDICEIGASLGENTDRVLELDAVKMTLVDPCLDAQLTTKFAGNSRVKIERGLSLEVLPSLQGTFDCFLIDGDHNWYTVYNELRLIKEKGLLRAGGSVFFHDVNWPYDRRDMYYDPSRIPAEYLLPHAKKGIVRGKSLLADSGGTNGHLDNALHEGGPRNGVLTAVEDFWKENRDEYELFVIDQENGLGVMLRKGGPASRRKIFEKYRSKGKRISWIERVKDILKPSRKK